MKIINVTIVDDEGKEQVLEVNDGTALLLCEDNKVLTQVTQNAAINLEIVKKIFNGVTV